MKPVPQRILPRLLPALLVALIALSHAWVAEAQLPAGLQAIDVGEPAALGRTRVDAHGVVTIQGSGTAISGRADQFHFAYQRVRGDGSIVARLLSQEDAVHGWAKTGPMIRESTAAGSTYALLDMTGAAGLDWQWRLTSDGGSSSLGGHLAPRRLPLYLRVQRSGSHLAGFLSDEGLLWRAATHTVTIPMGEEALFGLAITSTSDGEISRARYDRVALLPGFTSPFGITACGGDRRVALQWMPLPGAVGYHLYRGDGDATLPTLTRITTAPLLSPSFVDTDPTLINGSPVTYAVAAVTETPERALVEGPLVAVRGTPQALPDGLMAGGIGARDGAIEVHSASRRVVLRALSGDTWSHSDSLYFAGRGVDGDWRITATLLTKPTRTNDWAKAGIMIRESLRGGARNFLLGLTAALGVQHQWRFATDGLTRWRSTSGPGEALDRVPLTVRLTRRGDTITPEVSLDGGATFTSAGAPYAFAQPLSRTLYLGLSLSGLNTGATCEATFQDLRIERF
jgi:hypothetical protein